MQTRYERHTKEIGDVVRVETLDEAEVYDLKSTAKLDRMVDEAKAEIAAMVEAAKRKLGLLPPKHDDRADALQYLLAGQQQAAMQPLNVFGRQQALAQQQYVPPLGGLGALGTPSALGAGLFDALGGLGAGLFGGQAHGRR